MGTSLPGKVETEGHSKTSVPPVEEVVDDVVEEVEEVVDVFGGDEDVDSLGGDEDKIVEEVEIELLVEEEEEEEVMREEAERVSKVEPVLELGMDGSSSPLGSASISSSQFSK